MIQKDMYGASIDLKDAYYHILIVKKHRKFLRVSYLNIIRFKIISLVCSSL